MSPKNTHIKSIILIAFFCLFLKEGRAQTNMAFYPLEKQFNSSGYNPAFLYSDSHYTFSIFPLAGMNLGYNNQEVIRKLAGQLTKGINEDEEYLDIVRSMVDRKSFNQKLEMDLLNFTARSAEGFFNFRIRENVLFAASIKGPVAGFMIKPEFRSVQVGEKQSVPLLIVHYREYSIGYSSPSDYQDFSWGIRGKLYYGKGVFSSDISGSVTNVAGNHYFKTDGYGKMSMPEEKYENSDGSISSAPAFSPRVIKDYLLNSGNSGAGVDLGFRYRVNPKMTISASVLDIGNIRWKNNLTSKDFRSESLLEESKLRSEFVDGIEIVSKPGDSISFDNKFSHLFKIDNRQVPFETKMPVTFYSGIKYQVNRKVSLNFVDRYIKLKRLNHNTMMFSTGLNLTDKFEMSAGFSVIDQAVLNMPVALLFKRYFGQAYIGTDNLFSFLAPNSAEFSGLTFGVCFYVFRKRDLYGNPDETYPFYRPKKVKKVMNNGRIQKETTDFGFPEMY